MFELARYAIDELRENYDNRFWWRVRLLHRIVGPIQRALYGTDGVDVPEEDWDNLLVLDACRADSFEECADLDRFDEYRRVTSQGSATAEWVRANFAGRELGDTVYVNGNPWVSREAPDTFHRLIDVWEDDFDEEHGTVMAETMNEHASEAAREYDDKRLIVHYNQPHGPYVGGTPLDWDPKKAVGSGEALSRGLVTEAEFRAAYRDNLEYVLEHALALAEDLEGKTVVAADHGELFGKRLWPIPIRTYAHPIGLRDPDLVEVPWAVIDDERRTIREGEIETKRSDSDELEERLEDLGYRT